MASEQHSRRIRRLLTAGLVFALVLPLIRNRDGLPLSTYPMYSGTRSSEMTFVTAVGVAPDGSNVRLSMPIVADTRDALIAQAYLRDAAERDQTDEACERIAGRLGENRLGVVSVEIARERHDAVRRVAGEPSLIERELYTVCAVGS